MAMQVTVAMVTCATAPADAVCPLRFWVVASFQVSCSALLLCYDLFLCQGLLVVLLMNWYMLLLLEVNNGLLMFHLS